RLAAVRLLSQGMSAAEVAHRMHIDPRSVRRWRVAAQTGGEAGLAAKPASGRPRRLTAGDLTKLSWVLFDGPRALGLPADPRNCAELAAFIQRQFGVRYHPSHVSRILHRLGIVSRKQYR
ncbi:MAG: helix-turn-helix domain-containing protein, partial [Steroidobacteraceae bacterium]